MTEFLTADLGLDVALEDLPREFEAIDPARYQLIAEPLAVQVAYELQDVAVLRQQYDLTEGQYNAILTQPSFQELVKLHKAAWDATDNTVNRIEAKAALALERALLPVARVAMSADSNDAVRIQAAKLLKDVSVLGDRAHGRDGDTGKAINIQINLNGDPQELVLSRATQQEAIDVG